MKKIIYIKTIQLLIIDGIMLAFLTFKEGLILNEKQRANEEAYLSTAR